MVFNADYYTVEEIAGYLRINRVTVWRMIREGVFPNARKKIIRNARFWAIPKEDFKVFLKMNSI